MARRPRSARLQHLAAALLVFGIRQSAMRRNGSGARRRWPAAGGSGGRQRRLAAAHIALLSLLMLPLQMATAIKPAQKPGVEEAEAAPIHRIRITLTSKNVRGQSGAGCLWCCSLMLRVFGQLTCCRMLGL